MRNNISIPSYAVDLTEYSWYIKMESKIKKKIPIFLLENLIRTPGENHYLKKSSEEFEVSTRLRVVIRQGGGNGSGSDVSLTCGDRVTVSLSIYKYLNRISTKY